MLGFIIVLIIILVILGLPFLLLAPGRIRPGMKEPFYGRCFAHRGLHSEDKTVPENSLEAFRLASEAGYGMELDVQLSRDGQVVVFHDDTLDRVCGVNARVDELDLEELRQLRLCATDERIPLFSEVLDLVAGRGPVIVELKRGKRNAELCEKTLAMLEAYEGDTCMESFDPFIVSWFRKHAPHILRGQLSQLPEDFRAGGIKAAAAFALGNVLTNVIARPHFIAYRIGRRTPAVRLSERMGAMPVGWTSRDPSDGKDLDAVIFEFYRPDARYK